MFRKILVANRGEIAVRVIRACRELGIQSVAIYSDVDRGALHVCKADEAYPIGPAAASLSYLSIDNILEAARRSGAEAIHPGYGFLSENADFVRACTKAGIKFIGPSADAMESVGSKTGARRLIEKAGILRVPGADRGVSSLEDAKQTAEKLGYPVMLKAAGGGGGKGMRLVHSAGELQSALASSQSEALRAFGSDEVYIEKFIANPRHIEVQVFGDEHGNIVYLGERECSIQRRHQKVIEEAPSAIVDAAMRRKMGETAVRVAQTAGYVNAGTVEFLVDSENNFYFLEMNTRLQVEHPVTEMVTGMDLVHLQIKVAAGEKLPFKQEDVEVRGHAIECRIYAEDPENNFFPSPGLITALQTPAGPGIREDSGIYQGWRVPMEYDPLLSKLIAFAPTREMAVERLIRALGEYFIGGIATNLGLFRQILQDTDFRQAKIDTGYLERLLQEKAPAEFPELEPIAAIAAAVFASRDLAVALPAAPDSNAFPSTSEWKRCARREGLR